MYLFHITKSNGTVINLSDSKDITHVTSCEQRMTLNGDSIVSMSVKSTVPINFSIGDTFDVYGKKYKLYEIPTVQKEGIWEFTYNLTFKGIRHALENVIYSLSIETTNNTIQDVSANALIGDCRLFMTVLVANLNRVQPNYWQLGECPTTDHDTSLSFSDEGDTCFSVLNTICSTFDMEYEIIESAGQPNVINIKQTVGANKDEAFIYGKGEALYNISRENIDTENLVTRLYAYGSTENITQFYRAARLIMPGKTKNNSFLESSNIGTYGVVERTKIFDDIRPTWTGRSAYDMEAASFYDYDLFNLNAVWERTLDDLNLWIKQTGQSTSKEVVDNYFNFVAGTARYMCFGKPKIHFMTGGLAGMQFELLSYDHSRRYVKLAQITNEAGIVMPSNTIDAFRIKAGDQYKIIDISLPQQYVDSAETRLRNAASKWLEQNSKPRIKYSVETVDGYFKALFGTYEINHLSSGDSYLVQDTDLTIDEYYRIISFTRDLLKEDSYHIEFSLHARQKPLGSVVIEKIISGEAYNKMWKQLEVASIGSSALRHKSTTSVENDILNPFTGYVWVDRVEEFSLPFAKLSLAKDVNVSGNRLVSDVAVGAVFEARFAKQEIETPLLQIKDYVETLKVAYKGEDTETEIKIDTSVLKDGHNMKLLYSNDTGSKIKVSLPENVVFADNTTEIEIPNGQVVAFDIDVFDAENGDIFATHKTFIPNPVPQAQIISVSPEAGSTNEVDTRIQIEYSIPITENNLSNISLQDNDGNQIDIDVSISDNILKITPIENLKNSQSYIVNIPDDTTIEYYGNFNFEFYTFDALELIDSYPQNGASDVAVNDYISLLFSRQITLLDSGKITLFSDEEEISFDFYVDDDKLTIAPATPLKDLAANIVTVQSGAIAFFEDEINIEFETQQTIELQSVSPQGDNIQLDAEFEISFTGTIREGALYLIGITDDFGRVISYNTEINDNTLKIIPQALENNRYYYVSVPSGSVENFRDPINWDFTTIEALRIIDSVPRSGDEYVDPHQDIEVYFNIPMQLNDSNLIFVVDGNGNEMSIEVEEIDEVSIRITHQEPFENDMFYTVIFRSGSLGAINNDIFFSFSTGAISELSYVGESVLLTDFLNNTRNGHNPSSQRWEDLSGMGNDLAVFPNTVVFGDEFVTVNYDSGDIRPLSLNNFATRREINQFTVEFRLRINGDVNGYAFEFFNEETQEYFSFYSRDYMLYIDINGSSFNIGIVPDEVKTISFRYRDTEIDVFLNGEKINSVYASPEFWMLFYHDSLYIGRGKEEITSSTDFFCIRIYDFWLEDNQIISNYQKDTYQPMPQIDTQLIFGCPLKMLNGDKATILTNNGSSTTEYLSPFNSLQNLLTDAEGFLSAETDQSALNVISNVNNWINNFRLEIEFKRNNITAPNYPNLIDGCNSGQSGQTGIFTQRESNVFNFGIRVNNETPFNKHILQINNTSLPINVWFHLSIENRNGTISTVVKNAQTGIELGRLDTTTSLQIVASFTNIVLGRSLGYGERYANSSLRNFKLWNYNL